MGTCYEVIIEQEYNGTWYPCAHFDLQKSYEFARCFPHKDWPKNEIGRFPYVEDEGDLPAGGTFWASYEEVVDLYDKEMKKYPGQDFKIVRACLAAAKVLREEGEVRLLIWGE